MIVLTTIATNILFIVKINCLMENKLPVSALWSMTMGSGSKGSLLAVYAQSTRSTPFLLTSQHKTANVSKNIPAHINVSLIFQQIPDKLCFLFHLVLHIYLLLLISRERHNQITQNLLLHKGVQLLFINVVLFSRTTTKEQYGGSYWFSCTENKYCAGTQKLFWTMSPVHVHDNLPHTWTPCVPSSTVVARSWINPLNGATPVPGPIMMTGHTAR